MEIKDFAKLIKECSTAIITEKDGTVHDNFLGSGYNGNDDYYFINTATLYTEFKRNDIEKATVNKNTGVISIVSTIGPHESKYYVKIKFFKELNMINGKLNTFKYVN